MGVKTREKTYEFGRPGWEIVKEITVHAACAGGLSAVPTRVEVDKDLSASIQERV